MMVKDHHHRLSWLVVQVSIYLLCFVLLSTGISRIELNTPVVFFPTNLVSKAMSCFSKEG